MVQCFDILVLLNRPSIWHIRHAELLALVNENSTALEAQESGQHLRGQSPVFKFVRREPGNCPRLVVILEIQCVPSIVLVHECLPL